MIWIAHQATSEEPLHVLPALLGHEERLRRRVALPIRGIEDHGPAEPRNIPSVRVLEKPHHAHTFTDTKPPARIPREPFRLRRCVKLLDDDDVIARLRLLDDAHLQSSPAADRFKSYRPHDEFRRRVARSCAAHSD